LISKKDRPTDFKKIVKAPPLLFDVETLCAP
jgi:hypothetical protein